MMIDNIFEKQFFNVSRSDLKKQKNEILVALRDHVSSTGFTLVVSYLFNAYKSEMKNRSGLEMSDINQVSKNCYTLQVLDRIIKDLNCNINKEV